ncbi:hypothetical protein AX17_002562 [Amanita inopinata Kibby_2008]|nr:hypothetical protein AX17_002562 [Amanita inopinata Kibby_2008]
MQLIFELCAPADRVIRIPSRSFLNVHHGYTLIVISHVCSAWRTLVVTMPHLWNHIQLDLCHRSELKSICIEAAHVLLARATRHSGGCIGLFLSLKSESLTFDYLPLAKEQAESLYKLITSFPFRKLGIVLTKTLQTWHGLRIPTRMWYDEEFRSFSGDERMYAYPVLSSPGMDLSRLGLLEKSGSWNELHPDALMPWHQVWHLDLPIPMLPSVLLDTLRQTTLLEHCVTQIGASSETSWHQQAGTVTLPKLKFFILTFSDGGDARPFLDRLSIPNVTTLEVYCVENRLNCDEMTFVEMAGRSGGMKRLESLKLGNTATELDMTVLRRNIPEFKYFSYNQKMLASLRHPYMT